MTGKDTSSEKDTQQEDQATTQQRMNTKAQQEAATGSGRRPGQRTVKDINGNDVPFYEAPAGHASAAMSRLSARAREQDRTQAKVDYPDSATPEALANSRPMVMPAGGLEALARLLFPGDLEDQDAMDQHLQDLLNLNRDTLRDDTGYTAGQIVRVPA